MARWRDVKKRVPTQEKQTPSVTYAHFSSRLLALVVDIFMIGIPITIIISSIFGYDQTQNQPSFLQLLEGIEPETPPNPLIPIVSILLWMITLVGFLHIKGQTPGKKMAHIKVVHYKTYQNASILQLVVRFIALAFSFFLFFFMFFSAHRRTPHDFLSATAVIKDDS